LGVILKRFVPLDNFDHGIDEGWTSLQQTSTSETIDG
jgi:hypothetical protein